MSKLTLAFLLFFLIVTVSSQEKNYTDFVQHLKQLIQQSPYKGSSWQRLAYITDTYGPRMWGSKVLQMVIQEMKTQANQVKFQNVRLEPVVNFTKWVRGKESLNLIKPREWKLDVIGLGASVPGNVQAEVIVVSNYQELEAAAALGKVEGKIVCFNAPWIDYEQSVTFRVDGPSKAAKYGAVATLVRSVASSSIYSVHTGYMEYNMTQSTRKIPCAAITVEDAQMFARMQAREQKIEVHLVLESSFVENSTSSNLIFEIVGTQFPDQIVLAGGHIDSWDTGSQTGANDDGGGFITVFEAFRLLLENGYRPRRTLRFIAWSGQQSGSYVDGAAQYNQRHKDQISKHVAAFESDLGSTLLLGFAHDGTGQSIVKSVLTDYLSILGASQYSNEVLAVDTEGLGPLGVPRFCNVIKDTPDHTYYFRYHHSAGDSMSMMNPDQMDSNVVGIAAFLYIIADLQQTVRNVTNSDILLRDQSFHSQNLRHELSKQ